MTTPHLVLVGCGHAQLHTLKNLERFIECGCAITVVNDSEYHYYSGMGPGLVGGTYQAPDIRFNVKRQALKAGARFVQQAANRCIPDSRRVELASGETVEYDVVSMCVGSTISHSFDTSPASVLPVKPIINLWRGRRKLTRQADEPGPLKVVVAGGGPAGVEVAGNCVRLASGLSCPHHVTLLSRSRILSGFPSTARRHAVRSLQRRGVQLLENTQLVDINEQHAVTPDNKLAYDLCFLALGVSPNTIFDKSGIPTDSQGAMLVDSHLRSVRYPRIFGGGDCATPQGRRLQKVGVHAVHQGPILQHNLLTSLTGGKLKKFKPVKHYMLIFNLGDGTGIATKWGLTWHGRIAMLMKDWIDRRFMQRYQI
jgi:NADH dehydrogenase FAD-containing subunit